MINVRYFEQIKTSYLCYGEAQVTFSSSKLPFFRFQKYKTTLFDRIQRNCNNQWLCSLYIPFNLLLLIIKYFALLLSLKSSMFYFYLPTHIHSAFVPYRPEVFEKTNVIQAPKFFHHLEVFSQEALFCDQSSTQHQVLKESRKDFNLFDQKEQKIWKTSNSIKEELNDVQYKPHTRNTKKATNSKLNQNRNILPNTIHQLLSFVQRRNRSGKNVQSIFNKYAKSEQDQCTLEATFNINRFYIYQKQIKNKIGNYVTEEALKKVCNFMSQSEIFSREEQFFYNKVCRILIMSYLQSQGNCSVLLSKRMHSDKKIQHIKVNRQIKNILLQKFIKSQTFTFEQSE